MILHYFSYTSRGVEDFVAAARRRGQIPQIPLVNFKFENDGQLLIF